MSSVITISPGSDIKLMPFPGGHAVVVAPAPLRASLDLLSQPCVAGMFTFDPGVTWPDREGCRWAGQYLTVGHAIFLVFESLSDAQACHKRMLRSAPATSTEAPA